MAVVFSGAAVSAAAAAIFKVFEADLVRSVSAALEAALDVWGVAVEQHRSYGHRPGKLVGQRGALAVGLAREHVVGLFAHHVSGFSRCPNIHSLFDVVKA